MSDEKVSRLQGKTPYCKPVWKPRNLYVDTVTGNWTVFNRHMTFHHTHSNGHSHGPLLAISLNLLKWLLSPVSGNHELASDPE